MFDVCSAQVGRGLIEDVLQLGFENDETVSESFLVRNSRAVFSKINN